MITLPGLGLAVDPVWLWLALGVALAVPYVAVGRRQRGRAERAWWAVGLVTAALVYVAFALARGAWAEAALEAVGVAGFGAVAVRGMRDRRWLVAGWALHPAWDLGVHVAGGVAAPAWYVWACLSFDVVVAAAIWRTGASDAGAR